MACEAFLFLIFIYLAVLSLCCSMQDPPLSRTNSLVVGHWLSSCSVSLVALVPQRYTSNSHNLQICLNSYVKGKKKGENEIRVVDSS